jgi:hypothetical protein
VRLHQPTIIDLIVLGCTVAHEIVQKRACSAIACAQSSFILQAVMQLRSGHCLAACASAAHADHQATPAIASSPPDRDDFDRLASEDLLKCRQRTHKHSRAPQRALELLRTIAVTHMARLSATFPLDPFINLLSSAVACQVRQPFMSMVVQHVTRTVAICDTELLRRSS